MQRKLSGCFAMIVAAAVLVAPALIAPPASGQVLPGGPGQMPGRSPSSVVPEDTDSSSPSVEKSDAAAKKAFKAGVKSLNKAKEFEAAAAAAQNADKKAKEMEKVGDAYNRALDEFTEALSNQGDMLEAWDNVGYVHLRLGAYAEAIDDYNHALALKPELLEAVEHRGEAYLAVDRLEEAKIAYMDLFNHAPNLADQLMLAMQKWLTAHRADAHGMRAADVDAFDKWLMERDGIAKQTASLPH
jgi:tetratricopeptide (TPR) repeat protein